MAEKRLWWLMISEDFFNSLLVKKMRKIPGGDAYVIIYMRIQLMALVAASEKTGVCDGMIFFEGVEDDLIAEIALDLEYDVDAVRFVVEWLAGQGIIEWKNHDIVVHNINAGSEGASAARMRAKRNREKLLPPPSHSDADVTGSDADVTTEQEQEQKQKKEQQQHTDIDDDVVVVGGDDVDDTCPIELRSLIVSLAERYGDTYVADKVAQLRHQKNVKNPCGWLRRACEQDYHQSTPADSAAIQAGPDCPICHGTGRQTRLIGDTGQSMTYDCDCVRRRRT